MSEHFTGTYYGSSVPEIRLVLLGNIGCGKTSSADTILGQPSPISLSASRSCRLRRSTSDQRNVTVVEAPRWYWTGGKVEDSVRKETQRAMMLVAPGPHAILLLVPINQFTEMEAHVPAELKEVFGEEVLDHTLVLLTCGDYLMGLKVEDYLQKEHPGLRQIVEQCRGRYHVINNRQPQNREQVQQLLKKVEIMVKENGTFHMKTAEERELEKRVKDRKQELMEQFRALKEERKEKLASIHTPNTRPHRRNDGGEEKRTEEKSGMEGRTNVQQVYNELYSTSSSAQHSRPHNKDVKTMPRSGLNAALQSQMPEVKSSPKQTTTLPERTNSVEDGSPKASVTSASQSLVFSSPTTTSFPSSSPELRLVLLGRSGSGKSTAGNIILGQEEFETCPESLTAITKECEKRRTLFKGKQVAVVDTPDWFNSERTPDDIRAQISACVTLSSPGPHAFLFCIPLDQPAKTELQALRAVEFVFGPDAVQKHTLVLFTYADRLNESEKSGNGSVEAYIAGQRDDLLKIVEKCRDRYHVLELGGGLRERSNVKELLEKVDQTVKEAGGQCYSCPAFQEAENRIRQRQIEIIKERKGNKLEERRQADVRQLSSERRVHYLYMQPVAEAEEEEMRDDELEKTRDEAEMSVKTTNIESLPPVSLSSPSPSLLHSLMEKMQSSAKQLSKLLADSAVWASDGATKVKSSPVWGTVGSGVQNVQKMVVDSPAWGKVGESVGQMSKLVGDRVPKVVVDSSAWVGSGAKAAAASPMWGKIGSGAKVVADSSMRVGAGIGTGAKKVAQSPVWGKMGSSAKAGTKMVAESSVWGKIGTTAKQVIAWLGLMLGAFWGRVIGGSEGGAPESAGSEASRHKLSGKNTSEKTDEAAKIVSTAVNKNVDSLLKRGEKALKTE